MRAEIWWSSLELQVAVSDGQPGPPVGRPRKVVDRSLVNARVPEYKHSNSGYPSHKQYTTLRCGKSFELSDNIESAKLLSRDM